MPVVDVDAHFHEPADWLAATDPALADLLGSPARFIDVADAVFGVANPAVSDLPSAQQPATRWDTILPGFTQHLQMTDDRQPARQTDLPGDPFCDAAARLTVCDAQGIDIQFLNPSFLVNPLVQAARSGRADLAPRIRQCWNRWAMDMVHGHTDRLIPVTQVDLNDISGAIEEMARMRKLGSRAFSIGECPVGIGRRGARDPLARSLSHPDFEPLWSAAEDLNMAAIAHVGFGRERIQFGWANNGADDLSTYSLLSMAIAPQIAPQLLLGALVFDGVFERHPQLTVVIEEVGISWLPHLLTVLDNAVGRTKLDLLDDGEFRPDLAGAAYHLPLAPSEYLQRQVLVTPLVASEPLHPVFDHVAPGMLCFSSDYPHVEGTRRAIDICERQLAGNSETARQMFYGGIATRIGL